MTDEMGRYFDTPKARYSWFSYKIPTEVAAMEAIPVSYTHLMPEDTEELAGGQWQGNREPRLEIPTFHH